MKKNEIIYILCVLAIIITLFYVKYYPLTTNGNLTLPQLSKEINSQHLVFCQLENIVYKTGCYEEANSAGFPLLILPAYLFFGTSLYTLLYMKILQIISLTLCVYVFFKLTKSKIMPFLLIPYLVIFSFSLENYSSFSLLLILSSIYFFKNKNTTISYILTLPLSLFRPELCFLPAYYGYKEKKITKGVLFIFGCGILFLLSMLWLYGHPLAQLIYNIDSIKFVWSFRNLIVLPIFLIMLILAPIINHKED
jgi:hypothetical protein